MLSRDGWKVGTLVSRLVFRESQIQIGARAFSSELTSNLPCLQAFAGITIHRLNRTHFVSSP